MLSKTDGAVIFTGESDTSLTTCLTIKHDQLLGGSVLVSDLKELNYISGSLHNLLYRKLACFMLQIGIKWAFGLRNYLILDEVLYHENS